MWNTEKTLQIYKLAKLIENKVPHDEIINTLKQDYQSVGKIRDLITWMKNETKTSWGTEIQLHDKQLPQTEDGYHFYTVKSWVINDIYKYLYSIAKSISPELDHYYELVKKEKDIGFQQFALEANQYFREMDQSTLIKVLDQFYVKRRSNPEKWCDDLLESLLYSAWIRKESEKTPEMDVAITRISQLQYHSFTGPVPFTDEYRNSALKREKEQDDKKFKELWEQLFG